MNTALKVMVVDDTITYRMIMKKVAETIPGIYVMATASNGKLALDKLNNLAAVDPDSLPGVLLLDVEMPVMDGLATLKHVRKKFPGIAVVMVSGLSRSNANIVLECLEAGALDFVTKPMESNVDRAKEALHADLEPILAVIVQEARQKKSEPASPPPEKSEENTPPTTASQSPRVAVNNSISLSFSARKRQPSPPPGPSHKPTPVPFSPRSAAPPKKTKPIPPSIVKKAKANRPDLVLIGSSTGGPVALTQVLGGLKQPLPVPTLIVQHMPPVFTASLAAQLSRTSGLTVKESEDGMKLEPGSITLAMGGKHMALIHKNGELFVSLNDGPKVNECRPAVDVLFMSVMATFPGQVLAIILTGMGRDGANGVDALKRAGKTYCITQNRETCVVYGMPRSVEEKKLSDLSLPLQDIGPTIAEICSMK